MFRIHRDHDDHSVYAGWLGRFRRRISGHDREGRFPDEGSCPFRCVCLFTAAGRDKDFAVQDGGIRLKYHTSAGRKSDASSRGLLIAGASGEVNLSPRPEWFCLEFSWRR